MKITFRVYSDEEKESLMDSISKKNIVPFSDPFVDGDLIEVSTSCINGNELGYFCEYHYVVSVQDERTT